MGYLYRPKLKEATPLPAHKGKHCTHKSLGREDVRPGCGARFSEVRMPKNSCGTLSHSSECVGLRQSARMT